VGGGGFGGGACFGGGGKIRLASPKTGCVVRKLLPFGTTPFKIMTNRSFPPLPPSRPPSIFLYGWQGRPTDPLFFFFSFASFSYRYVCVPDKLILHFFPNGTSEPVGPADQFDIVFL